MRRGGKGGRTEFAKVGGSVTVEGAGEESPILIK